MTPKLQPIPAPLAFIVLALAATLVGCSFTSPGPGSAVGSIEQAQGRVSFPIVTPACVPQILDPRPLRVAIDTDPRHGQVVYIDYGYRDPPAGSASGFPPATLLEQPSQHSHGIVIQAGQRQVLDGTEVAIDTSSGSPSLEWIQGQTLIQLVATIPLNDALRVYHSMVTHSSDCALPK
jgi:hypothetical protein